MAKNKPKFQLDDIVVHVAQTFTALRCGKEYTKHVINGVRRDDESIVYDVTNGDTYAEDWICKVGDFPAVVAEVMKGYEKSEPAEPKPISDEQRLYEGVCKPKPKPAPAEDLMPWRPNLGERVLVRNEEDEVWLERQFVSIEDDRFLCYHEDSCLKTPWKHCRPCVEEIPLMRSYLGEGFCESALARVHIQAQRSPVKVPIHLCKLL